MLRPGAEANRIQLASRSFYMLARVGSLNQLAIPPGAVAQLGERLICIQEVIGSIPFSSTSFVSVRLDCTGLGL